MRGSHLLDLACRSLVLSGNRGPFDHPEAMVAATDWRCWVRALRGCIEQEHFIDPLARAPLVRVALS